MNLGWLYDRINLDPTIKINYVNTAQQLADILTKWTFTGERWTQLLTLFIVMSHSNFTKSVVVAPAVSRFLPSCQKEVDISLIKP